jgi:hypothetical protein
MEGSVAIETNREALIRIVASLVAMAAGRPTITRHVWRTTLRLLRPAESAARRLIIAAARGIVVPPPKLRSHAPKPGKPVPPAIRQLPNLADREAFLRRFGIAVTGSSADRGRAAQILPCEAEGPKDGRDKWLAPAGNRRRRWRGYPIVNCHGTRGYTFKQPAVERRLDAFGRKRAHAGLASRRGGQPRQRDSGAENAASIRESEWARALRRSADGKLPDLAGLSRLHQSQPQVGGDPGKAG